MTGLDVLTHITERELAVRVLFVSGRLEGDDAYRLVESGAYGLIEKDATFDEIADAIASVAKGERVMSQRVHGRRDGRRAGAARPAPVVILSDREREILAGLARGLSAPAIAERAGGQRLDGQDLPPAALRQARRVRPRGRRGRGAAPWADRLSARADRTQRPMKIVYTQTDEAPALATHSLLPIIEAFAAPAGVELELRDISLAGRILAQFPDRLGDDQRVADALAELGELAKTPEANIIKLPNISASVPQLKAAIEELQGAGYDVPDYPDDPKADPEVREAYDRVKGSAVNPVLREGNSDRRAPASVKAFARAHPHSMGAWSKDSRTHVSTMGDGDFRSTERSVTLGGDDTLRIEHVAADGTATVLKESVPVLEGEIVDAAVMRRKALDAFLEEQIADAEAQGVLFSVHLKATMMKVSDPIIFGHAVGPSPPSSRSTATSSATRTTVSRRSSRGPRPRWSPRSGSASRAARTSPWSTPTAASPTCTCRAT